MKQSVFPRSFLPPVRTALAALAARAARTPVRPAVALGFCLLAGTGLLLCLSADPALAGDLGDAMDKAGKATERGFSLIDAVIYILGLFCLIGGALSLRNGRHTNTPHALRTGIAGILLGLMILGWKGWTDGFYTTVGIDESGAGYTRPHMK